MQKRTKPPGSPSERIKHYRFHAEKLRTIASEWLDSATREILTRVARDYEHMAERLEKENQAWHLPATPEFPKKRSKK